ncbi:MAG: aminotransferase class I/II-fold pyridoxal phosphate-dependent enzyme [Bacteroidales bacterium]
MIQGHGDDLYKYKRGIVANFSSNVYNAVDLSGLKRRLTEQMNLISSYPEPAPYTLEELLAQDFGCSPNHVCVTNGATEGIYLIAQTFREVKSAIFVPTFSEYEDACKIHKHQIEHITTLPNVGEEKVSGAQEFDMVWICNPNNPTGLAQEKKWLIKLIENNPKTIFVLDQSYEYFTLQPVLSIAEGISYNNVILLHSMTKRYAIPGLRLGYITASAQLMNQLKENKMPWSVNSMAIEAGIYLLKNGLPNVLDMNNFLQESRLLAQALESTGIFAVLPSHTHYMLVKITEPLCYPSGIISKKASHLKEYLANNHGILIRDASNFATLDETYFRIAAQTQKENTMFMEKINALLESISICNK